MISEGICLLCSKKSFERCTLKDVGWKSLRQKSKLWVGLDTFGNASQTVNWDVGPECHYMHANCKVKWYDSRSLKQAKKRKERLEKPIKSTEEDKDAKSDQSAALAHVDSTRLTCRSFDGAIHSKELCIWCMKPGDKRHKKRFSTLHLIDQV